MTVMQPGRMKSIRPIAPLIPCAAVIVGLFWLHNAWAAVLGFHFSMFAILWIEKPSLPIFTLLNSSSSGMLFGCMLLCAFSGVFLFFVWPVLGASKSISVDLAALGLSSAVWPAFIGYFVLINPWLEEYFWRGYLGSPVKGLTQTDFLFAGYHLLVIYDKIAWIWSILAFASLTFIGWLWRQATHRSNGLLVSSLSHMAADFSILTAVYLIVVT